MAKNKDRYFEALDMKKRQRAKLTPKQYLVYSYLVSISKWNANKAEQHYYTYKIQDFQQTHGEVQLRFQKKKVILKQVEMKKVKKFIINYLFHIVMLLYILMLLNFYCGNRKDLNVADI